jgi:acyl-coenzyme A synthetase/AMP-(fatty) acid ligase
MPLVPFLGHAEPGAVVAYRDGEAIRAAEFARDVWALAAVLPARRYLINLCADRYRFAVGLAAALLREQVSLLPPSHAPHLLQTLEPQYGGLYALTDGTAASEVLEDVVYPATWASAPSPSRPLAFAPDQLAAVAFTSGSTGVPTPHPKSWGRLALGAVGEAERLGLRGASGVTLVGTVPPQHMYGLESTVLLPLHNGLALHAARPFYPADIHAALEQVPPARVLVTTPVHLRALLGENSVLPALRMLLCATAPLSSEMASAAEARYGAPLNEIYGFTEAGMVATRRPAQEAQWHALPGVKLWRSGGAVHVFGGHVQAEVAFSDVVEIKDEQTFVLLGRGADMVNVAGKRTSLASLKHQLSSIPGVLDGAFFMPEEGSGAVTRLSAFVVAPGLTRAAVQAALRARIDAAFLPRPLYLVDALPRNATGKLPQEALASLAQACARRRGQG